MKPSFWKQAWKENKTGFHRDAPHPDLRSRAVEFPAGGTVLIPLCGVTHDLRWLAEQGFQAIGVEVVPQAVQRLVEREGLVALGEDQWGDGRITVLQADFFDVVLDRPVDVVWDRAALVALHPSQREAYVAKQRALLGSGRLLLNTLSYAQERRDGPPWSVDRATVEALWPELSVVREEDVTPSEAWRDVGIESVRHHLFEGDVQAR